MGIGLSTTALRYGIHGLIAQRQRITEALTSYPVLALCIPSLISAGMVALSFVLMRRFAPETSGNGIPQVEGALVVSNVFPHALPAYWLGL